MFLVDATVLLFLLHPENGFLLECTLLVSFEGLGSRGETWSRLEPWQESLVLAQTNRVLILGQDLEQGRGQMGAGSRVYSELDGGCL